MKRLAILGVVALALALSGASVVAAASPADSHPIEGDFPLELTSPYLSVMVEADGSYKGRIVMVPIIDPAL